HKLAIIYQNKNINYQFKIKKDIHKVIKLYEKAIHFGDSDAMNDLALIYREGNREFGIKKDINKSIELQEKAIDFGNIDAMESLAEMYLNGIECTSNIDKPIKFYIKLMNYMEYERCMKIKFLKDGINSRSID